MRLSAIAFLILASAASAQSYRHVTAGTNGGCLAGTPILREAVEWVGTRYEPNTDIQAVAPGQGGRVLALAVTGGSFMLVELDPSGGRRPLTAVRPGYPYALAAAADGSIYVLASAGLQAGQILAFDPSGAFRTSFALPGDYGGLADVGGTALDLAADQCTLFVIDGFQTIRRFNVCTGQLLPDFTSAPFQIYASLRVLPDGGLLVGADGGELHRFGADGVLTRVHRVGGDLPFALILESGGRIATYGYKDYPPCRGQLETIDLESGNVVAGIPLRMEEPTTLTAYYGWTAALGPAHAAEAPAMRTIALLILTAAIAAFAILRLR